MSSYLDLDYRKLDRAAIVLGAMSIMSAGFIFVHGTFQLVQIGAIGLVVGSVLGLLAIAAGLLAERALMLEARSPRKRERDDGEKEANGYGRRALR